MQSFDWGEPAFVQTPTDTHQLAWWHRRPVRFDVTSDVQALLAHTTDHELSWLLRNTAELNGVWVDLHSRESSKTPRLILETRVKPPEELIAEIEAESNRLVRTRYQQAHPDFDPAASVPTVGLEERLVRNSYALLDSLPPDAELEWNTDLREAMLDNNKQLATALVDAAGSDGLAAGVSREQAINNVRADIINAAHDLRAGDIPVVVGDLPPGVAAQTSNGVITLNADLVNGSGQSLAGILAHEATHDAFHDSVAAGSNTFNQKGINRVNNDEVHHKVIKRGGLILCGDDGPCGNYSCTHDNSLLERVSECISAPSGSQPICRGLIDLPCVRVAPPSGGCFLTDNRPPAICQTVLCGSEYSVGVPSPIALPQSSVALARDCCGGAGEPVPGGGGFCSDGPWKCECCINCSPCPEQSFVDPAVPALPCIGCTSSVQPPGGPD
jgi:hypothetical protein